MGKLRKKPSSVSQAPNLELGQQDVDEILCKSQQALGVLWEAYRFAHGAGCDIWQFAVPVRTLLMSGATESTLRWLIWTGYAEHAMDRTRDTSKRRVFHKLHHVAFADRSCLVLTRAGIALAQRAAALSQRSTADRAPKASDPKLPYWDREQRALWYDGKLVKIFRQPAYDQELILSTFQELNWTKRVDDPIPGRSGIDCKKRLHDTTMRLNQHQVNKLLHFSGDGTGHAVCWQPNIKSRAKKGRKRQSSDRAATEQRQRAP